MGIGRIRPHAGFNHIPLIDLICCRMKLKFMFMCCKKYFCHRVRSLIMTWGGVGKLEGGHFFRVLPWGVSLLLGYWHRGTLLGYWFFFGYTPSAQSFYEKMLRQIVNPSPNLNNESSFQVLYYIWYMLGGH